MTRIRFEDLPSTNTPRNAENLNKLNNLVISSTEPTTGEEVWIDDTNKKIYTKNHDGNYNEFYNETKLQNYSTEEQIIGTWLGKNLYRKVVTSSQRMEIGLTEIPHDISNIATIKSVDAIQYFPDEGHFPFPLFYSDPSSVSYIRSVNDTNIIIYCGESWVGTTYIILEYAKTTD